MDLALRDYLITIISLLRSISESLGRLEDKR